ncbi:competence type IV pilus minor pilin ComGF [Virgibacillus sp. Bac332]|uniref:competence type IV pilus minor pilin ComGF n=1 Tax=Virgibacillus sp. Bac332 TaxID=2419842 RepID=UPI00041FBC1C|nr:ComGF family competence protein [Virgibacillus sp. Bac332]
MLKSISNQSDIHELSIQQFFQHLRNEVMQATDFRIVANKLLLESNGATVSFELYQELIRRQVNGLGHEIYVRGVKDFSLAPLSYGFQIIITSTEGDTFEKDIILYE